MSDALYKLPTLNFQVGSMNSEAEDPRIFEAANAINESISSFFKIAVVFITFCAYAVATVVNSNDAELLFYNRVVFPVFDLALPTGPAFTVYASGLVFLFIILIVLSKSIQFRTHQLDMWYRDVHAKHEGISAPSIIVESPFSANIIREKDRQLFHNLQKLALYLVLIAGCGICILALEWKISASHDKPLEIVFGACCVIYFAACIYLYTGNQRSGRLRYLGLIIPFFITLISLANFWASSLNLPIGLSPNGIGHAFFYGRNLNLRGALIYPNGWRPDSLAPDETCEPVGLNKNRLKISPAFRDLSNADFSNAVLFAVDFPPGTVLENARFDGARITHAEFRGVIATDASFSGACITDTRITSGSRMTGLSANDATFINVQIADTNLNSAELDKATISFSDIIHTDLRASSLSESRMFKLNLQSIDISDSILKSAWIVQSRLDGNLSGAIFSDTLVYASSFQTGPALVSDWQNSTMIEASFKSMDLSGASFRGSKFYGVLIESSELNLTDFSDIAAPMLLINQVSLPYLTASLKYDAARNRVAEEANILREISSVKKMFSDISYSPEILTWDKNNDLFIKWYSQTPHTFFDVNETDVVHCYNSRGLTSTNPSCLDEARKARLAFFQSQTKASDRRLCFLATRLARNERSRGSYSTETSNIGRLWTFCKEESFLYSSMSMRLASQNNLITR